MALKIERFQARVRLKGAAIRTSGTGEGRIYRNAEHRESGEKERIHYEQSH